MWTTCGVLSGVHSSLPHRGRLGGSGDKEGEACGGQAHRCSASKAGTPALVSLPTCWLCRSQYHPCPSFPALSLGLHSEHRPHLHGCGREDKSVFIVGGLSG